MVTYQVKSGLKTLKVQTCTDFQRQYVQQISATEFLHIIKPKLAVGFRPLGCKFVFVCIWSVLLSGLWRLITHINRFWCARQPCFMVCRPPCRGWSNQTLIRVRRHLPTNEEPSAVISPHFIVHPLFSSLTNHCLSWLLWSRHEFRTEASAHISAHA